MNEPEKQIDDESEGWLKRIKRLFVQIPFNQIKCISYTLAAWCKTWWRSVLIYIILFGLLFLIFPIFNIPLCSSASSAKYLLSALVQSQAAVIAIVVTLTLVAVQLSAQAYSPRVITIFQKSADFRILLSTYIISIVYNVILLETIPDNIEGLEMKIRSSSFLAIFAFLALFPYMCHTMNLLKPRTIINRLAEKIEKDSVLKFIEHSSHQEDPLQPIVDIVRAAVMKYDFETARNGIADIKERCLAIVSEYSTEYGSKEEKEGVKKSVAHFSNHLKEIAKLAIERDNEEVAIEAINNLGEIGMECIEKGLFGKIRITIESVPPDANVTITKYYKPLPFKEIKPESSENQLEGTIEGMAEILQEIGTLCAEKELEKAIRDVGWYLAKLGTASAAEKELEKTGALRAYAKSLAELTRLDTTAADLIKNALSDYESALRRYHAEENYLEAFSKFRFAFEKAVRESQS